MTMEYHSAYIIKKARRESALNRQRRAAVLAVVVAAAVMWAVFGGAFGGLFAPAETAGEYVSAGRGDSLWSIAEEYKPEGEDTRAFMRSIMKLNDMDAAVVYEGQILFVPTEGRA